MARKKEERRQPLPANVRGPAPVVAIVGRPNVGKSTLFNRRARQRIAIVEDVPGVTRDRNYADAEVFGREVVVVDTGGFDPESDDPMKEGIAQHVRLGLFRIREHVPVWRCRGIAAVSGDHHAARRKT